LGFLSEQIFSPSTLWDFFPNGFLCRPRLGISSRTGFYAVHALGFLPERVFMPSTLWDFFPNDSGRRRQQRFLIQNFSNPYIYCFTFK
jgi:hypothetical protein